jgi:hypothetical protein
MLEIPIKVDVAEKSNLSIPGNNFLPWPEEVLQFRSGKNLRTPTGGERLIPCLNRRHMAHVAGFIAEFRKGGMGLVVIGINGPLNKCQEFIPWKQAF